MIQEIINPIIEEFIIDEYEETILIKCKYNFILSEYEKFRLDLLKTKLTLTKLIIERKNKKCVVEM